MRSFQVAGLLLCANADVYMHNPRGSNDRNCERNVNRNNGNRMFDSQNNAKGGYACPRAVGGPTTFTSRVFYYEDSLLPIEWTAQHGCGPNSKVNCEMILQFACEDTLDTMKEFRSPAGCGVTQAADGPNPPVSNENGVLCGGKQDPNMPGGNAMCRLNNGCIVGSPRDGTPQDANDAATDTMPLDRANAIPSTTATRRYGMHENYDFYQDCRTRARNRGLFTADQRVRRNDATGTRQNPNGNRNGLECPEERDYYPYWHPSPWKDIAVLTNQGTTGTERTERCKYYQENSQNVKPMGMCVPMSPPVNGASTPLSGQAAIDAKAAIKGNNNRRWYNNNAGAPTAENPTGLTAADCADTALVQGDGAYRDSCYCAKMRGENVDWQEYKFAFGYQDPASGALPPPACLQTQFSRVNQLGNGAADEALWTKTDGGRVAAGLPPGQVEAEAKVPQATNANRFLWRVPKGTASKSCVLRLRYNISTTDYAAWAPNGTVVTNSESNGAQTSPVTQDPYVNIREGVAGEQAEFLSLAVNTNQYGRTFQDRSYVFEIRTQGADGIPPQAAGTDIINLNVRGKRGNIVQTYPAVEYDFVPNDVRADVGDWIHFQWTGSDYNPRRGCNNGEGGPPDAADNNARNNARADRSNIVMMEAMPMNYPATQNLVNDATGKLDNSLFALEQTRKLAFLDQTRALAAQGKACLTQEELAAINNKNERENHPQNCAKLNAAGGGTPYFNGGAMQVGKKGRFAFFSSRNNNFSNRDQTGTICVTDKGGDKTTNCGNTPEPNGLNGDNPSVPTPPPTATAGAVVVPTTGTLTPASAAFQLASDVPAAVLEADILTDDLLPAAQEKDNDGFGDGEKEGCEPRSEMAATGASAGEKVAIGLGACVLGAGVAAAAMFAMKRGGAAPASRIPGGVQMQPPKAKKADWLKKTGDKEVI